MNLFLVILKYKYYDILRSWVGRSKNWVSERVQCWIQQKFPCWGGASEPAALRAHWSWDASLCISFTLGSLYGQTQEVQQYVTTHSKKQVLCLKAQSVWSFRIRRELYYSSRGWGDSEIHNWNLKSKTRLYLTLNKDTEEKVAPSKGFFWKQTSQENKTNMWQKV